MTDLNLAISRLVDQLRDSAGEPVWLPLELTVPADWCGGFMWMGATEAHTPRGQLVTVFRYKHGVTRSYLNVGADLNLYRYRGDLSIDALSIYEQVDRHWALAKVYRDLEVLGATPETRYDAYYIAARNARLREAGFEVIS